MCSKVTAVQHAEASSYIQTKEREKKKHTHTNTQRKERTHTIDDNKFLYFVFCAPEVERPTWMRKNIYKKNRNEIASCLMESERAKERVFSLVGWLAGTHTIPLSKGESSCRICGILN